MSSFVYPSVARSVVISAALTLAAVTVPVSVGSARADAPSSGCPRGYVAHTLSEWAALGHVNAPQYVDNPANGGNGDGIVCGNLLGQGTDKKNPTGGDVYQFRDNNLPASTQ